MANLLTSICVLQDDSHVGRHMLQWLLNSENTNNSVVPDMLYPQFTYDNCRQPHQSASPNLRTEPQRALNMSDVRKCDNLETLFNPLNPELNPIFYLLALLAHHFLHVSRIRVKSLTLGLLMSYIYMYIYIYIYGAPILDVSRSHTTTQHSR